VFMQVAGNALRGGSCCASCQRTDRKKIGLVSPEASDLKLDLMLQPVANDALILEFASHQSCQTQ
jgi:hypothetical protein